MRTARSRREGRQAERRRGGAVVVGDLDAPAPPSVHPAAGCSDGADCAPGAPPRPAARGDLSQVLAVWRERGRGRRSRGAAATISCTTPDLVACVSLSCLGDLAREMEWAEIRSPAAVAARTMTAASCAGVEWGCYGVRLAVGHKTNVGSKISGMF